MSFKSILSIATAPKDAPSLINAAASVTLAQDGHLDVLALGIDLTQIGYSYIGGGAVLLAAGTDRAETDARAAETAVRAALDEQPPALRWAVECAVAQFGGLTDLVALRARFADLVVLSKPYGKNTDSAAEAAVEAALFEGQAPVLIMPDGATFRDDAPRRIVIGWNQSREAMVAVRRALPFLQRADMVNIAVINPPSHGPERSDPGGALCQMLVRHGVKAEVSVLAQSLPRVSDVLAQHARDVGADLLVMGAYGHSRFAEAILGGATRNLLEATTLPLFLAH